MLLVKEEVLPTQLNKIYSMQRYNVNVVVTLRYNVNNIL